MTANNEARAAAPLVTAVVVCWNHERFARAAVLSALNQTHPNVQLLVFENGSSDGSRRVLEAVRSEHEFTLVCQDNIGLVRTLNLALGMAKGKYFTTLAADDMWIPDKLGAQVRYLEEHTDVHLVSGQVTTIDADGNPSDAPIATRYGEATFAELMTEGNYVYGPTIMCRTDTLRALGGYDESMRLEDYSLALRLTHAGMRAVVLPDIVTWYRKHGANWSVRSIDPELHEIGLAFRHTPEYRGFYRRHFPLSFWRLVKDGHKGEALRVLLSEPVPWTWANVGRGLTRMAIPYGLIRAWRSLVGKPPEGHGAA